MPCADSSVCWGFEACARFHGVLVVRQESNDDWYDVVYIHTRMWQVSEMESEEMLQMCRSWTSCTPGSARNCAITISQSTCGAAVHRRDRTVASKRKGVMDTDTRRSN